jgi:hypothetical protein
MDHNDDDADTDQAKAEAATAAPAAPHTHEGWINVPCSCAWCGARGRAAPSTGHEDDDGGGGDGSVVDADTATVRRREEGGWGDWGARQRAQGLGTEWPAARERAARKRAASEARERASWQSAQGWPQGREEGEAGPKVRRKAGPKVGRQGDDEDDEDEEPPLVVATSVDDIHVNMPWAIFERWNQYREMSPAQQRAAYATDGRDLHAAPVVYLHGAYHQTWYDGNGDPSVKVYSAAGWGAHLASLAEDRRDARVLQCSRRSTSPSY